MENNSMLQQHARGVQKKREENSDPWCTYAFSISCHWRSVLSKEECLQVLLESLLGCRATLSQGEGQTVPYFWCSTGKGTNPEANFRVSLINTWDWQPRLDWWAETTWRLIAGNHFLEIWRGCVHHATVGESEEFVVNPFTWQPMAFAKDWSDVVRLLCPGDNPGS